MLSYATPSIAVQSPKELFSSSAITSTTLSLPPKLVDYSGTLSSRGDAMAIALETVVKQLEDSGIVAKGTCGLFRSHARLLAISYCLIHFIRFTTSIQQLSRSERKLRELRRNVTAATLRMISLHSHPEGVILPVRAQPGARRAGIRGEQAGSLKVSVIQVAEKGKANKALVSVLCEALNLRPSQLELISGETVSQKRFLVREIASEELAKRITACLE